MNLLTNSKLISFLWWTVVPPLTALLLSSIMVILLGNKKIQNMHVSYKKSQYLKSFPKFKNSSALEVRKVLPQINQKEKLGKILLQACYAGKNKKFIIFKDGIKTVFLDLNQSYKNAKVIEIGMNYALFLKDGKRIKLLLENTKTTSVYKKAIQLSPQRAYGGYVDVKRVEFKRYTQNIRQALRDVRVQELRKGKQFAGLRLGYIRKGSFFDRMKLRVGDVIKSVDGNELKSIMDLLPYYNRLDNITTLRIGFERGGGMKEIIYEIN